MQQLKRQKLYECSQPKIFTASVYAKQVYKKIFQKAFLGDRDSLLEFQKRKDLPLHFVGSIRRFYH